ncbi:MAG: hypothetical protein FJ102_22530 [Deltaproteobacteria bacterium]|nr:hypothetical protein [Deltaproteobacteria bacterium]
MILALAQFALANADGKTGATVEGCTCHGDASSQTAVSMTADATSVDPAAVVNITLLVQNASMSDAGMNAAADGGSLEAGDATRESRQEITHDGPSALSGGQASFSFSWTAPSEGGTYTISAVGNATNADDEKTGDQWAFADPLEIVVLGGGDTGIPDSGDDAGDDTATGDTGKAEDPVACGCNAATPVATLVPALGALMLARRRD